MVFFLPWWFCLAILFWVYWKYELFEIIIYGFLMDILYASFEVTGKIHNLDILGINFQSILVFTVAMALGMYILNLIKKRIRF